MLDVRKEPGSVIRHSVSREDLLLINRLAKSELGPDQVYTFAVRLCDNEVDRDWERFDQEALEELSRLFVGKSGIFDHNWSAEGQTARLYRTEICREEGRTMAGDEARFLKGYAYMLRNEKNQALIEEIEAGIKKEVSVGCSVGRSVCSICGAESGGCAHVRGQVYDGGLCFMELKDVTDAYEWSFVAVPAQRRAGILKRFGQERDGGEQALRKEAELGRKYLRELRREVVRLAMLADDGLDGGIFAKAAGRLEEPELLELRRTYEARAAKRFPLPVQLRRREGTAEEDASAFLV